MKSIALAIVLVLSAPACLPGGKGLDWPALEKCAPPAADILDLVVGILSSGSGTQIGDAAVSDLEDAAAKYGPGIVQCAVDYFVSRETAPTGRARTSAAVAAAATRGDDFLRRIAHHEARP